jgi:hypothetical protein
MDKRLDRAHRAMPLVLGVMTPLISLGALLAWDVNPKFFPARAHGFLAAFPLAMIAIAYLLYQSAHRGQAIRDHGCKLGFQVSQLGRRSLRQ